MQDTIYSLFERIVKAYTDEPAIIENNRALTFGELSGLVDRAISSPVGTSLFFTARTRRS